MKYGDALHICVLVLLYILCIGDATAQVKKGSVAKDSTALFSHPDTSEKYFEKVLKVLGSRDSLAAYKDSPAAFLVSKISPDSIGPNKDSLQRMVHSLPGKDSVKSLIGAAIKKRTKGLNKDSIWNDVQDLPETELKKLADLRDKIRKTNIDSLTKMTVKLVPEIKKPASLVQVGSGYVHYNYMFRSAIDTPYIEKNMGQHMINASLDISIADIPFRISYYGRQSNSQYLRDYNDFRVEFNAPAFRQRSQDALRKRLSGILDKFRNPALAALLKQRLEQLQQLKQLLNGQEWQNRYIKSKQVVAYRDKLPDNIPDKEAVVNTAEKFIRFYEQNQAMMGRLQHESDSLQAAYTTQFKKSALLEKKINGNMYTAQGTQLISKELKSAGLQDKKTERLLHSIYAVRTLAVGRTLPNRSNLTVKNLNVKGLDFEYNASNLYAAITAGMIDFRTRDFMYGKPSRVPQYVYAASIGYGMKEGSHLILTGYTGKKQIISNNSLAASALSGMSVEAQWMISRNIRVTGEVAQSTSPVYASADGQKKQGFKVNDNSNKAYSLQVFGYFPTTQTRLEGYYQRTGINFQNFTNYRVNANVSTWNIRMEQYLWKKQLRVMASARKNDYSNPFIVQQYNSNTVFTSLAATFRRRKLPSLTVGYMPSSQYTIVGGQVAENRYQSLNISMAHAYRIGVMQANGSITYNRFYNAGSDTGFLYYNANHFFTYHQFVFPRFTASMGYSRTANSQYSLDVMEGGLALNYARHLTAGAGVKINKYNVAEVKTGLYANLRASWTKLGDITLWYERGYLPGSATSLLINEWFTLGFTRYFNTIIKL